MKVQTQTHEDMTGSYSKVDDRHRGRTSWMAAPCHACQPGMTSSRLFGLAGGLEGQALVVGGVPALSLRLH